MNEQQAVELWLKLFNKQWKEEQSTTDIWDNVDVWLVSSCDVGEYYKQDVDDRRKLTRSNPL